MFPAIETLPATFANLALDKVSAKAFLLKACAVLMVVPARWAPVPNIPDTPLVTGTTLLLKFFQPLEKPPIPELLPPPEPPIPAAALIPLYPPVFTKFANVFELIPITVVLLE